VRVTSGSRGRATFFDNQKQEAKGGWVPTRFTIPVRLNYPFQDKPWLPSGDQGDYEFMPPLRGVCRRDATSRPGSLMRS
jgi:hypothetical protein